MSHHLIVVHEFGNYAKGHHITDADEIARVLASPQHTNVVKIAAPAEQPAPVAPASPTSLIEILE